MRAPSFWNLGVTLKCKHRTLHYISQEATDVLTKLDSFDWSKRRHVYGLKPKNRLLKAAAALVFWLCSHLSVKKIEVLIFLAKVGIFRNTEPLLACLVLILVYFYVKFKYGNEIWISKMWTNSWKFLTCRMHLTLTLRGLRENRTQNEIKHTKYLLLSIGLTQEPLVLL